MQASFHAKDDSDAVQTATTGMARKEQSFAASRPATVAHSELGEIVNNSPRMLQQRAQGRAIHHNQRSVAQRHDINALTGVPRTHNLGGLGGQSLQLPAMERRVHGTSSARSVGRTEEVPLQRQVDIGKLNVVGENHGAYSGPVRQTEREKVEAIFGHGKYHTEDTFSAMPDIAQEGGTAEEKDSLQSFFSKADPPYYAITQGLTFIMQWCDAFRTYHLDRHLLTLINAAQARIEKEIISEPLKKLEGTDEERNFVLAHEELLFSIKVNGDPNYPKENLAGRDVAKELVAGLTKLRGAARAYHLRIETEYAGIRGEYEHFMDINPDDNLIKKRSASMAFHAMAHALGGHTGVLKVGEYHLVDFAQMDLGDATLSSDDALQDFLSKSAAAQVLSLQAAGKAGNADERESVTIQQQTVANGLPETLKAGIESLSGFAMDDVKVHYNSPEPAKLDALAYAQGTNIHVGPGQEQHLPHEAWHVAQQKQGRVKPTVHGNGSVAINDDAGLEDEADNMGRRAMHLLQSSSHSVQDGFAPALAVQRISNVRQPVQLLSDFEPDEWQSQLHDRDELRAFPAFAAIVQAADNWVSGEVDDHLKTLTEEIRKLGASVLDNGADILNVYGAIERYFPETYLSIDDVRKVKTYNFDGPIMFTAENVMAWLRLASGDGTVDDLRYIHHEMHEIKKIEGTAFEPDLVETEPSEAFWEQGYAPAHGAALMVEIRFLMHAVNMLYKKDYSWQHVAASDIERREDFLGTLYDDEPVPLGADHFPDMEKVEEQFGAFVVPELSALLTTLKQTRLDG